MKNICNKCFDSIMTMDIRRKECPYCKKIFNTPSIPGFHCCIDCAKERNICQICGKKLK